ncbi:hypothetical protein Ddc_15108 [Ditylenchus destructor]|nr:hypothetical protein Ddc_15108 [Ditylenchus destructor]
MYKRRLCPSVPALNCQMENHVSEKSERSQNTSDDSLRLMRTHLQTHFKHRLPVADEKQYKCAECSYSSTDHGLFLRHKCKGGNKKQLKSQDPSKMHTSEEYRPLCLMPGNILSISWFWESTW